MIKKIVSLFVIVLFAVSIFPSSFAATNKAMCENNWQEAISSASNVGTNLPLLQKLSFEPSAGVNPEKLEYSGSVIGSPTKNPITLHGFDINPSHYWFSFQSDDPSTLNYIGEQDPGYFWAGEYVSGTIYAVYSPDDSAYYFGTVDKDTFEFTRISDAEPTQDMSMDYSTGTMYAICNGIIKTVDLTSGEFISVANVTGMESSPIAMAISTNGDMYGIGLGEDGFYSIDKSSGVSTLISHVGYRTNYAQSATFDHATQTLYWAYYGSATMLVKLDITTGEATVIGSFAGDAEVTCLMSFNDNVVLPDPVPVSGVELTPENATVIEGRSIKLNVAILPVGAYILDRSVTYSSSDDAIATVDANGFVTGISPGRVTITVTSTDGGYSDSSQVDVISRQEAFAPISEALNAPNTELLYENDDAFPWEIITQDERLCVLSTNHAHSSQSSITLELGNVIGGSTISWDWKTSSENGYDGVLFLVNGEIATSLSGESPWMNDGITFPKTDSYTVQWIYMKDSSQSTGSDCAWVDNVSFTALESAPVDGVEIHPVEAVVSLGTPLQMYANVTPINAANTSVTWSSQDPNIATVDESGLVTGVTVGSTSITVTTDDGGFSATAQIEVIYLPDPVLFTDLDYSESIDPNGDLISFTLGLGTSTRLYMPDEYGVTSSTITYGRGFCIELAEDTGVLLETLSDLDTVMWVYDTNFNLCAVNDDGEDNHNSFIKYISPADATYYILVTGFGENMIGDISLSVEHYTPVHVTGVSIERESMVLGLERYATLKANVIPENADVMDCVWTTSDDSIVAVDSDNAMIYGVALGSAMITVTTADGGFSDTIAVDVRYPINPEYDGKLYGFRLYSSDDLTPGFVSMNPANGGEQLDDVFASDLNLYSGEYYDGLLYCYSLKTVFIYQVPSFCLIDPTNWTVQAQNSSIDNVCTDLSYNYTDNVLYGIGTGENESNGLFEVDMNSGNMSQLCALDVGSGVSVLNLACSDNGQLYITASTGDFYKITDTATGEIELVGNIGMTLNYVQSMTFDHISGALYMAQLNDNGGHLLKIDPLTAAIIENTPLGTGINEITSLFTFVDPGQVIPDPEFDLGDVNMDAVVNTGDVSKILRYLVDLDVFTSRQRALADYNGDGRVNTGDAAALLEACLQ